VPRYARGNGGFGKYNIAILPRQRAGQLGYVVISPAAPGTVRLEGFYAATEVAAEGAWSDAIAANARQLRGFALGKPPAVFRLVFFGGRLAINDVTIGAFVPAWDAAAVRPDYVPTNRLGSPMGTAASRARGRAP
jgi:hypothetical protein